MVGVRGRHWQGCYMGGGGVCCMVDRMMVLLLVVVEYVGRGCCRAGNL